ncbi:hypothetical protein KRE48_06020 [Elizabethkingia meningoseptica]|nr:hypothetical protein [Elizabethkingia meningoseptica]
MQEFCLLKKFLVVQLLKTNNNTKTIVKKTAAVIQKQEPIIVKTNVEVSFAKIAFTASISFSQPLKAIRVLSVRKM